MGGNEGSQRGTRVTQWAHGLGEERYTRDESAAGAAKSQEETATRALALSAERWTAIVAGIRRLSDAYNAGARRGVLSVVEHDGSVTISAGGDGAPSLTATLEDTLICVQARGADGVSHASDVRLRADRSDDATAAYLLQDWMQHL